ncbi:50S ribosomal protein L28 [Candidatus Gracilibacteria bacterium]|nr:50S ribosomal protein L28 [Candidatus Gracilibacteria bacterium]MCF7819065.1 50S ribosomal protein L28 [Candidatus Gracilibacteria bacterium]
MARTCQITGKKTSSGNTRPFSLKTTKRTFRPNLFMKKIWNPLTGKVERIKVSAKGIKTIKKIMRDRGIQTEYDKKIQAATERAAKTTNQEKGRVKKTKLTPKQKKELQAQKEQATKEEMKPEVVKEIEEGKKSSTAKAPKAKEEAKKKTTKEKEKK